MVRRRTFLLTTAATASIAGCSDAMFGTNDDGTGSATGTDESGAETTESTESAATLPSDLVAADEGGYRVDVAGSSDGEVTVEGQRIEYRSPVEITWRLGGAQNGTPVTPGTPNDGLTSDAPPLSVSRRLDPGDDYQHAFIAPIYESDADRFELWYYVDGTYLNAHEEHYIAYRTQGMTMPESREADFTERADGIYRDTITYDVAVDEEMEFPLAVLLDTPISEVESSGGVAFTGVAISPQVPSQSPHAPQVAFEFEYDENAKTVTVTHHGGDTVDGENLQVRVEGSAVDAEFPSEVTAGTSATVDVSGFESDARLRVVWTSPEGETSQTLAAFELP